MVETSAKLNCAECKNRFTKGGDVTVCKMGNPIIDESGNCMFYRREPEHNYSRKCENCLKYGKDRYGVSWCTNLGTKTKKSSSCAKFIMKG